MNILDRIHLRRATDRALFRLSLRGPEPVEPVPARAEHWDFGLAVEKALFRARRAAYAFADFLAAVRDRWADRPKPAASTIMAYGSVAVMASIFLNEVLGPAPANSSIQPASVQRPDWVEIARAQPSFALEAAPLAGLDMQFHARRHRQGGGRKDILTFGHANAPGVYMRVSLYRPGGEGMAEPDPLEAAVSLAAESGIDADLQETSGKIRTKFGDLPAINMRVHRKGGWRNCVAATGAWSDPRFGLVAWWCNPGPEIVALGEFACVLDRIALMSAGGDDQLAGFFARAELRRTYCEGHSSFVSPTPRLGNGWIDAKRGPQLRGGLTAR